MKANPIASQKGDHISLIKGYGNQRGRKRLIEKDPDFYNKLNINYKDQGAVFDKIIIDITTRCNLKCSVCYRRDNSSSDPDINTLIELANRFKGRIISISGGEPTGRADLPEIIKMFSKKNTVFLITNGIKLSDLRYLMLLKENGLRYVSFSLNALSNGILSKINGEDLLYDKLKALENLKRLRIKVVLTAVLVKGLNEKELKKLFEFYLNNRDFIYEFRIRAMAHLGAYLDHSGLYLSEMIDIVAKELDLDKEDLLKEFELKREVNAIFRKEIFALKSCSLDFHIKTKKGIPQPILKNLNFNNLDRYPTYFKKIIILFRLIRAYGISMIFRGVLKLVFRNYTLAWIHPKSIFKVGLRCWPDTNTINLEENRRCRTGYWLNNGEIVSFCYANIIKERLGL